MKRSSAQECGGTPRGTTRRRIPSPRSACGALLLALLVLCPGAALARPPELHDNPDFPHPAQMQTGRQYVFRLVYKDPEGDRPQDMTMIVVGPGGNARLKPEIPRSGDFRAGVTVDWQLTPEEAGPYQIYYEASSVDGKTRFPPGENSAFTIPAVNVMQTWILLAVGLGVAIFFLPMCVFFVARGISQRTDPGATARFALLVGILAAAVWYVYLFHNLHQVTTIVVVSVFAFMGMVFVVATMRRAAR